MHTDFVLDALEQALFKGIERGLQGFSVSLLG